MNLPFLMAMNILMCGSLFALLNATRRGEWQAYLYLVLSGAGASAIFLTLAQAHGALAEHPSLAVGGFLFFGAGGAVMGARKWFALTRAQRAPASTWQLGGALGMLAAGVLVAFAAVDHFRFYRGDSQIGFAPARLLSVDSKAICPAGAQLVVFRMDPDGATYRCPLLVYGGSRQPFAPWPSYVEGSSPKLKQAVLAMLCSSARDAVGAELCGPDDAKAGNKEQAGNGGLAR